MVCPCQLQEVGEGVVIGGPFIGEQFDVIDVLVLGGDGLFLVAPRLQALVHLVLPKGASTLLKASRDDWITVSEPQLNEYRISYPRLQVISRARKGRSPIL